MAETVSHGLFANFTQSDLDAERGKYVAAVQQRTAMMEATGGGMLGAGSINGKQVTFSYPQGITSLEEWRMELDHAQAQLDGETVAPTDRTAARFV